MIEATGFVTVVPDPNRPGVAQLDVIPEYGNDNDGELFRQMVSLIGQEVFVLVLPKNEMLQWCTCGHEHADHFQFQNWSKDSYPYFSTNGCEAVTWGGHGHYGCPPEYCKCKQFTPKERDK